MLRLASLRSYVASIFSMEPVTQTQTVATYTRAGQGNWKRCTLRTDAKWLERKGLFGGKYWIELNGGASPSSKKGQAPEAIGMFRKLPDIIIICDRVMPNTKTEDQQGSIACSLKLRCQASMLRQTFVWSYTASIFSIELFLRSKQMLQHTRALINDIESETHSRSTWMMWHACGMH